MIQRGYPRVREWLSELLHPHLVTLQGQPVRRTSLAVGADPFPENDSQASTPTLGGSDVEESF
jgi:hypothetical protein